MTERLEAASIVERFIAVPRDTDVTGSSISIGRVLDWIARAGYACATRWSGGHCETASIGNLELDHAVRPKDVVELSARIVQTGTASMNVLVTIRSGGRDDAQLHRCAQCVIVFAAVDERGRPIEIPAWQPIDLLQLEVNLAVEERIGAREVVRDLLRDVAVSDPVGAPAHTGSFVVESEDLDPRARVADATVLAWMADAASRCASAWAGRSAAPVYFGGIEFSRRIAAEEFVRVQARLVLTTAQSMHILVETTASAVADGRFERVAIGMTIAVALDGAASVAVPPYHPVSDSARTAEALAERLHIVRSAMPALVPR